MSNNYMTEQYMTSILQQYRQTSPQQTTGHQNVSQVVQNEEQIRRQLNESLFKSIDGSFDRQVKQLTVDRTTMTDTPIRVQQMVREPVITSDSFRQPRTLNPFPNRNSQSVSFRAPTAVQSIRSQYFGQPLPQSRVRSQTYRAKVIDYSNGIIEKPRIMTYSWPQPLRQTSIPSVLTERNIDPMPPPARVAQSVTALQSAIASISQKPVFQRPEAPKPLLKNSAQNINRLKQTLDSNTYSERAYIGLPHPKTTPKRDSLVKGFENHGIIRTFDLEERETFYCYYCNTYLRKESKVDKHIKIDFHKNNINKSIENSLNNPLNKRFIFDKISTNETIQSFGLTTETIFRMELDRILPEKKHFYCVKGIRLRNPGGPDPYYCVLCNQSIQSLSNIESHFRTESHRKSESGDPLSKYLSQTTEPITGLQYITEYISRDLLQPIYECTLCKCFEEAYDMFRHISSFRHRINLLKQFNPNETILNSIKESPQAVKEINKRISYLAQTQPMGAVVKVRNSPNSQKYQKMVGKGFEVIHITDDYIEKSSKLKKCLAIRLTNEEQAADTAIVIQALKESVVNYYLSKIPPHMRRVLINKVMNG